jgi:hypothetical protein
MPTYIDQELVVGDSVTFGIAAKRNSLAWDITGGDVDLYVRDPSGNWSAALQASVTSGPDGEAVYAASTGVLDEAGAWRRQWEVLKDGVTKRTEEIEFQVKPWQS